MPCAINSSPARASRTYRQAMGIRTTQSENEREGIDGKKRRLAERRYRTAARLRAGSEIRSRGEGLDREVGPRPVASCAFDLNLIKASRGSVIMISYRFAGGS